MVLTYKMPPSKHIEDRRGWAHPTAGFNKQSSFRTIRDPFDHSVTMIRKDSRYDAGFKKVRKNVEQGGEMANVAKAHRKIISKSVAAEEARAAVIRQAKKTQRHKPITGGRF